MPAYELHTDPHARAAHIYELTGIMPDMRLRNYGNLTGDSVYIPRNETVRYIAGVQAGDQVAAEKLIATRLPWVYSSFASLEALQDRNDLELQDILQMGSLATLETAHKVDVHNRKSDPTLQLHLRLPAVLGAMVMQSKLVPTIKMNRVSHGFRSVKGWKDSADLLVDAVEPVGDSAAVKNLIAKDPAVNTSSIENDSSVKEDLIHAIADLITSGLSPRAKDVLFSRAPFADKHELFAEIAKKYGVIPERIRQINRNAQSQVGLHDDKGMDKAAENIEQKMQLTMQDLLELLADDQTNYGLRHKGETEVTPPQADSQSQKSLQEKWLNHIAQKQRDGKLTFVQGSLATQPIPAPIAEFISQNPSFYNQSLKSRAGYPASELKKIIYDCRRQGQ